MIRVNVGCYAGICFALMPLLNIYTLGIPFLSFGQTIFFILLAVYLLRGNKLKAINFNSFTIYAIMVTVINVFFVEGVILKDEVHDLFAWLFFILTLLGARSMANYQVFYKTIIIFGFVSVLFFYFQYLLSLIGIKISGLIPFLPLSADIDIQIMMEKQIGASRLSGFFMEPSHYAENTCLFLALFLFGNKISRRCIIIGVIISISIFLSQSAMGSVLVLCIWAWWYIQHYNLKFSNIIVIAPAIGILLFLIISGAFDSLLLRFSADYFSGASGEGHFSTYIRTVRGYIPFIESDGFHKLFGRGFGALSSFIKSNPQTDFLSLTDLIPNWINGLSYLLLCTGVLGTSLYIFMCVRLYKNNTNLGKLTLLIVLLLLVSSDSLFLLAPYFYIAIMEKQQFNSISFS